MILCAFSLPFSLKVGDFGRVHTRKEGRERKGGKEGRRGEKGRRLT